jgi:GTP cyclohydrolase I
MKPVTDKERQLVRDLLLFIGEDPTREGLLETPDRFLKACKHWFSGYAFDPSTVMKTFEDGAEDCNELVLVRDIDMFSHCEHHIAPIIGKVHVGYIPNGKIVGLSKLARLVEGYSRRLQVQERLTNQIASALEDYLQPQAVGVIIEAQHTCMTSRGIQKVGTFTITSALRGAFKDESSARSEFMRLCGY